MTHFKQYLLILIIGVLLMNCAGSVAWNSRRISSTEKEAKMNNTKILSLNIGDSKQRVLEIMGRPLKREAYQVAEKKVIEFFLYRTSGWSATDWGDKDYQFTPFAFENDGLIGWGRNFYDNIIRHAVDITMK